MWVSSFEGKNAPPTRKRNVKIANDLGGSDTKRFCGYLCPWQMYPFSEES